MKPYISLKPLLEHEEKKEKERERNKKRQIPKLQASRRAREYETQQQSMLLALLNKFCTVHITKQCKKAEVTHQFFRIKLIQFSIEDEINVERFLNTRTQERKQFEMRCGCTEKTSKRRMQINKKVELLHLLIDLLNEKGFTFRSRFTDQKMGSLQKETVLQIYYKNVFIFNHETIIKKSLIIHELISQKLLSKTTDLILKQNDYDIQNVLCN
ncbi:hypothetical protein ENUP19_0284G0040 [Entamoeba nuttalli]|uniref:Uncharacterized protein n=2 Tax=Entamoeba nuttalli TaxID=412467 RepID=K2H6T6_ENTNP|nr:hypothetical protein ENU1_027310 [Entamoeba nuttalli P19]EKE42257.1 hypothetical protein ENU1_027310 [Entamoeba nuttalli P19]|eukprot:XP_008855410.1 hypothetical protein ENU1_027310 [Entamoeba nuttalli P19]